VHWLPLAKFAYNNSIRSSTGAILFFTEKSCHLSIEATFQAILSDRSVPDQSDAKAQAEKLVELLAAIGQCWKAVTVTQQKYADRCTKPRMFEVSDTV
jgi:hypothetical protein